MGAVMGGVGGGWGGGGVWGGWFAYPHCPLGGGTKSLFNVRKNFKKMKTVWGARRYRKNLTPAGVRERPGEESIEPWRFYEGRDRTVLPSRTGRGNKGAQILPKKLNSKQNF